jgi:hypothetical protein
MSKFCVLCVLLLSRNICVLLLVEHLLHPHLCHLPHWHRHLHRKYRLQLMAQQQQLMLALLLLLRALRLAPLH